MEPKGGSSSAVVTAEAVKEALARRPNLSATEESVVRMRHGVRVEDPRAPLPQKHGDREDLKDELLLLEMHLLKAFRRHKATSTTASNRAVPAAAPGVDGKAKDKIVRALRKKR
ncbi:MAG TPA: hypothetical protein VFA20_04150 [Myxococcaceae bacterium]|nr:hypothetical protein [Myxococcaceae bacterium]